MFDCVYLVNIILTACVCVIVPECHIVAIICRSEVNSLKRSDCLYWFRSFADNINEWWHAGRSFILYKRVSVDRGIKGDKNIILLIEIGQFILQIYAIVGRSVLYVFGDCVVVWDNVCAKFSDETFSNKKCFMQVLEFDRSVCMSAVSYSVPLSAVLTKQQLHREKRTWGKLQIHISKIERRVPVYTARKTVMAKSTQLIDYVSPFA